MKPLRLLLAILIAGGAFAGELVVLDTGFQIRADRHEVDGDVVRLFTGQGEIELEAASVVAFEPDEPAPAVEPPAPEAEPLSPKELIDDAAERYGLPTEFLHSVAAVESAYQADAVSVKGAIGVMQLMPGTAAELSADPHDVEQNIDAGVRHLRDLLVKYDGGVYRALAAYNAGAGAVARYQGIPPYRETRLYVQKVLDRYKRLSAKSAPAER
ncbi:MAG: lytic transglycosylase domain-containing protein [bacterium]|nr:lytic transglycosylase domain-containing protein [bacterium]